MRKSLLRLDCSSTDIGERFRVAYISRAQGETSHHYSASKVPGKHILCRLRIFAHILGGGAMPFMDEPIKDANNLIVLRRFVVLYAKIICPIPSVLLYYRVRRRRRFDSSSSLTLPRPGIAVDAPKLSQDPPALRGKKARAGRLKLAPPCTRPYIAPSAMPQRSASVGTGFPSIVKWRNLLNFSDKEAMTFIGDPKPGCSAPAR